MVSSSERDERRTNEEAAYNSAKATIVSKIVAIVLVGIVAVLLLLGVPIQIVVILLIVFSVGAILWYHHTTGKWH